MNESLYNKIISLMDEKLNVFKSAGTISDWSYRAGETNDALSANYDINSWEKVQAGHTWSSGAGCAWIKKNLSIPAEVNGVSTEGSQIVLNFMLPIGATLFLNGEKIYEEPFWADTRCIPIELTDSYHPSDTLSVAIKAKEGDGFGLFCGAWLIFSNIEPVALDLEIAREQIKFCKYIMDREADNEKKSAQGETIDKALSMIDIEAISENRWNDFATGMEKAVDCLMAFNNEAKSYEVKLIAHSHIDMNWLWTMQETVDVCYRDFTTMDKLMEKYPGFRFSQSQASCYKMMEENNPEVFKLIQSRVNEGKWDITANTWVEGDLNTAMAETLSRQILHTRRYIEKNFNVTPKICWEPDTFGHVGTLPQILKKSGIEYYYHCRAGKGHPIYWWESPDGSRVLALNDMTGYGGEISPSAITQSSTIFANTYGLKTAIWVYGAGDHGGGATAKDIDCGIIINNAPLLPRTTMSSTIEFYEAVKNSGIEFPVVKDELNTTFEGCYTSHTDIKLLNRYGENNLLTAETAAACASIATNSAYPFDELTEAWQNQSFHQFHDILCGCAIGSTYRQAAEALKPSHDALNRITSDAVKKLAAKTAVNTGGIVVMNQLAWDRTDVASIPLSEINASAEDIKSGCLQDESGKFVPVQISGENAIFIAENVAALGCKIYKLIKNKSTEATGIKADANTNTIENDSFKMRVNPKSGSIDSFIMKEDNRELVRQSPWGEARNIAGLLNRFMVYFEEPHSMSAWTIGDITEIKNIISGAEVKLTECGPVFATIEVKNSILSSSLCQQIRVYNGFDRIDFITEVDWHEQGTATKDAPMLKVTFTPNIGNTKATYEIPYAAIERPADGSEVPALRWADLSAEDFGITLLNDCKYGHHAQGNTLAITLIRSSYEPDNNPDERLHKFTYSMVPHKGDWKQAGIQFMGAGLNQPLLCRYEEAHQGDIIPGKAYLSCEPANVAISAVKLAEDQPDNGKAIIIRLFEGHGAKTTAKLNFGWDAIKAEEVNIIEQFEKSLHLSGNSLEINLEPHEIKTIKLYTN